MHYPILDKADSIGWFDQWSPTVALAWPSLHLWITYGMLKWNARVRSSTEFQHKPAHMSTSWKPCGRVVQMSRRSFTFMPVLLEWFLLHNLWINWMLECWCEVCVRSFTLVRRPWHCRGGGHLKDFHKADRFPNLWSHRKMVTSAI